MEELVAFCGLDCAQCGAYLATRTNDDAMRIKTAQQWSEEFKHDINPQDINCDGCVARSDTLFSYCQVCEIRRCGLAKGVANCAHCNDYGCDKLAAFLQAVPPARERLERIRAAL